MATPEADARSLRALMTMAALVGAEKNATPGDAFLTGVLAGTLLDAQHPERGRRLVEMLAGIFADARGTTPEALMTTWQEAVAVIAGGMQEPLDKPARSG